MAVAGERVVVEKTAENVGVAGKVVVSGEEKHAEKRAENAAVQVVHPETTTAHKHILLKKIVLLEDIKLVVHLGINVK